MRLSSVAAFVATAALTIFMLRTAGAEEQVIDQETQAKTVSEVTIDDIFDFFKEEVEVASGKQAIMDIRESPGILSVITRKQIEELGARDLFELLRMVPGFDTAGDLNLAVNFGVRGMWANEGKLLFLVDGIPMNDLSFGTPTFGGLFFLDQIERIEIIRGPGSVLYGGFAGLGVINIITRSGKDLNGARVQVRYGNTAESLGSRRAEFQFGLYKNDIDFKIAANFGDAPRSEGSYYLSDGTTFNNVASFAKLNFSAVNTAFKWKGLQANVLLDYVSYVQPFPPDQMNEFTTGLDRLDNKFTSFATNLQYEFKPIDSVAVTPQFLFQYNSPWATRTRGIYYVFNIYRFVGGTTVSYDVLNGLNFLAGFQFAYELAQAGEDPPYGAEVTPFSDGNTSKSLWNIAMFLQGLWRNPIVTVTAGVRFEHHQTFGSIVLPRLALTKVLGDLHLKALASMAFRAPTILDIDGQSPGTTLGPEKLTVFELEVGYRFFNKVEVKVNGFYSRVTDAILCDPVTYEYTNVGNILGTLGAEAEVKVRFPRWYAGLTYSFYYAPDESNRPVTADDQPAFQAFDASYHKVHETFGFAAHKLTAVANISLIDNLSITPSLVWIGPRYGYGNDLNGDPPAFQLKRFDSQVLLNLNIVYRLPFMHGLSVGLAVLDILDTRYTYVSGFNTNGSNPSVPGIGREILLTLALTN
jgi:outer membrane cobalamin receptor